MSLWLIVAPYLRTQAFRIDSLSVLTLRVQVPNNRMLTQTLYYNYYEPKPKYLIIGYLDRLGYSDSLKPLSARLEDAEPSDAFSTKVRLAALPEKRGLAKSLGYARFFLGGITIDCTILL